MKCAVLALVLSLPGGCTPSLPPAPQALPPLALSSPDQRAFFLAQESSFAAAALKSSTRLKWRLLDQIKDLQAVQPAAPELQIGGHFYALMLSKGERLERLVRRDSENAPDREVVFNPNDFFPGGSVCNLSLSADERRLALSADLSGSGSCDLFLADLSAPDKLVLLQRAVGEFAWAPDAATIYFSVITASRPEALFKCAAADCVPQLVLREQRPDYYLSLRPSRDRELLLVTSASGQSAELSALDFARPELGLQKVLARPQANLPADHLKARYFAILENLQGQRTLYQSPEHCRIACTFTPFPAGPGNVEAFELFEQRVLIFYRERLRSRLEVRTFEGALQKQLQPEGAWTRLRPWLNASPAADSAYFVRHTPEIPPQFIRLSLNALTVSELPLQRRSPALQTTVEWVESVDGTRVPLTLVTKPGLALNPKRPVLVHVYGAYGDDLDASYRPEYAVLSKRGVDLAFCHARGGGELGPSWHTAAVGWHKLRSLEDFTACLKFLNDRSPGRVAAYGRSAGGLLVAAALQNTPQLLAAALLEAPFVDLRGTLGRTDTPHNARDFAEWGDPHDPSSADYLARYSPAETVHPADLPPTLVVLPTKDEILDPLDAVRWARRLRAAQTGLSPIVILPQLGATHARAADETQRLQIIAQRYAFVLEALALQ